MSNPSNKQLEEVYLTIRSKLLRFAVARLNNTALAEDIVQDLYIRLNRGNLSTDVENIEAFIFRALNNLIIDHRRKAARINNRDSAYKNEQSIDPVHEMADPEPSADRQLESKEKLVAVNEVINALPSQCRKAFTAVRIKGLSYREAAEVLGVGQKAIEKQISRAMKALMAAFPPEDPDPPD